MKIERHPKTERSLTSLRGFTLLELMIVMVIGSFVTMLVLGLLVEAREKSRQELCADNMRKIIRGVRAYEETMQRFPPGRLKPDWIEDGIVRSNYTSYPTVKQNEDSKTGFYSVHVWILPYVGAQKIYNMIDFSRAQAKRMTQGGQPFNINYAAYTKPMPVYLCPADPNTTDGGISENNYRYNFGGDGIGGGARSSSQQYQTTPRPTDITSVNGNGAFNMAEQGLESSAFTDGLTTTTFFSERTKGDGSDPSVVLANETAIVRFGGAAFNPWTTSADDMLQICDDTEAMLNPFVLTAAGRWPPKNDYANGWPFAGYDSTEYNHVAPPNWQHFDCGYGSHIPDTPGEGAIIAARSQHEGGVNVAFGDGRVKFIKDAINLTVWRAYGTRNGEEVLQQQQTQQQQSQQQQQGQQQSR